MAFAHVLASNGLSYFLCSLGYFLLGVILLTQLKKETHLPFEFQALKVLAVYGLVRGTFYFGELFFLISYQQVSPLTNGLVHELIWIAADYLTVLVFFVFALRLATNSGNRKGLQATLLGMVIYWTMIFLAANRAGLDFAQLATWAQLKAFVLCIPSFLIVVISFNHLSRRLRVVGFTKRAEFLSHLATAYGVQAFLVFLSASAHMPLIPKLSNLGINLVVDSIPILRFFSALVLMSIVYLVYSLVNSPDRAVSRTEPNRVENGLINDLGFALANQVSNVLEVDTVALFLTTDDDKREILCAVQGLPLNIMPTLAGEALTRTKVQANLSRKYKAIHTIPIEVNSSRLGTILIANRKRRPLSPSDLRFLHSVANQTGRTLLGLRSLVENIEAKAIQEERLRISREMHDGLSPLLSYMRFKIEAAKGLLEASDRDPLAHTFEEIDGVINEAFADVRESITGLRCSITENNLIEKLKETIEQFRKLTDASIVVEFPSEAPCLHPKQTMQILRIIQEVLTNVRKHAQATLVELNVESTSDKLIFTVEDNGTGFDPDVQLEGHFGLSTMRERCSDIGGGLIVSSQLGKGTRVTLTVPIVRKEQVAKDAQSTDSRRSCPVSRGASEPYFV